MQPNITQEQAVRATASSVRVRFAIAADGSFEVELLSSSGDGEVDEAILAAARRWRWKPALRDGQPVSSGQKIRFKINR